jgi:hypothetical protein
MLPAWERSEEYYMDSFEKEMRELLDDDNDVVFENE